MKKLVYLACPYTRGDVAVNVHNAILMAERVIICGAIPYMPLWTHFWHLISPKPWEYWIEFDEYYVSISDCVLRMDGESEGADREVRQAISQGKPIFYNLTQLIEYLQHFKETEDRVQTSSNPL